MSDGFQLHVRQLTAQAGLGPVLTVRQLGDGTGSGDHVFCVNERHVVRLGTGPDGVCFPQAAAVLRAIEGRVAAPRVLHTDFTRRQFPFNVMVCEYIPGRALCEVWKELTDEQQRGIVEQIARQVQEVHKAPIPDLLHSAESSPQRMLTGLEEEFAFARSYSGPVNVGRLAAYVAEHRQAILTAPPPVLLHNDLHWSNVIACDGQVVALIDFDDVASGPAEVDAWNLVHLVAGARMPHLPNSIIDEVNHRGAWQLVCDVWPAPFACPGVEERYVIWWIREILWNLNHVDIWQTAEGARREAAMIYRALVEQNRLR